jgi:hypothetical protein
MTIIAERLVEELGKLPPAELREVSRRVGLACANAPSVPSLGQRTALEVVHSLYGRFAGRNSLVHLLRERARDRAREEVELRRLSRRYG